MKHKGVFITFEGCEGSGKSTHAAITARSLKKAGRKVVLTREPGGTPLAETVRNVLLHPKSRISPLAELFLYEAARAQHVEEVIKPALKKGNIIICDRFTDATLAYQGYARGLDLKIIEELNSAATGGISPKLTVYIDVPAAAGLKKARSIKRGTDRLELEGLPFHRRVRAGYLALARKYPKRVKAVKQQESIKKTASLIFGLIKKYV